MRIFKNTLCTLLFAIVAVSFVQAQTTTASRPVLDVPYVPTRQVVVDAMLELAKVSKNDVLYDLGCGDGRIVITAAKKHGATGTGVDIDPERIKEANENARKANVTGKVNFVEGNLFDMDFSKASVVTLYLLPDINLKLRPQLLEQLKPGTRIVSHAFEMGDWKPEQTVNVDGATIYLWTVPQKK
ncbi:class I SAM-dependent methyltransferase [Pontibacter beigongshangensis]|uniref:class I SAM-dependent methyltransferase n=1 Tax=Pontibacter beigongshangensis TaxID=2574733 RepID=UPI001650B4D9|nr:class I SAM-dependent methyltransferase [Pontibacter beigongshangensis]